MKYTDDSGKDAETLAVLMDKAYAQGFLLTDDIIAAFPQAEAANEQLEELFAFLHGASIDVYEERQDVPAKAAPVVYLCSGNSCQAPTSDALRVREMLG